MNLEQAQQLLVKKREACWNHISDLNERRRVQNRFNKSISRWKFEYHLETVEDYCILLSKIEAMHKGQPWNTEGRPKTLENRPKRGIQRSKRRASQRLALKTRRSAGTDLPDTDVLLPQDHDFQREQPDEGPTTHRTIDVADEIRNDVLPDFSIDQLSLAFSNEVDHRTEMDNNTKSVSSSFLCLSDPPEQSHNVQPSANAYLFGNLGDDSSISRECCFDANIPIESSVEIHKDTSGLEDLSSLEHAQPTDYPEYHTQHQHWDNSAEQNSDISVPQISGRDHTTKAAFDWCSLIDFTTETNGWLTWQSPETPPESWNWGTREQDTEELDDIQQNGIVCHLKATMRERFGSQFTQESSQKMREARSSLNEQKSMVLLVEQCWEGLNAGTVKLRKPCREWAVLNDGEVNSCGVNDATLGYSKVVECAWKAMKARHCSVTSRARVW